MALGVLFFATRFEAPGGKPKSVDGSDLTIVIPSLGWRKGLASRVLRKGMKGTGTCDERAHFLYYMFGYYTNDYTRSRDGGLDRRSRFHLRRKQGGHPLLRRRGPYAAHTPLSRSLLARSTRRFFQPQPGPSAYQAAGKFGRRDRAAGFTPPHLQCFQRPLAA